MRDVFPVEREVSPKVAFERVRAIISELGLTADLAVDRPKVSHVVLSDRDGNAVGAGSGKGVYSVLGAHAEALEHLALDRSAPEGENRLSCQEIARQPNVVADGILRTLDRYAGKLPCFRLQDVKEGPVYMGSLCPTRAEYGVVGCRSASLGLSGALCDKFGRGVRVHENRGCLARRQ